MTLRAAVQVCVALAIGAAVAGCGSSSREMTEQLKGTWTVVEGTEKGKPLAPGARYKGTITFDKEFVEQSLTVEGDPTPRAYPVMKGKFVINASPSPAQIDFLPGEGEDPLMLRQGIFEFDGPRLKLCVGGPGQPRPGSFIGLSDGEILLVLEPKK
jgi:uncharacterized protein (TIGR03067 family)